MINMMITFNANKIAITSKKCGYACASTNAKTASSIIPDDLAASNALFTK